MRIYVLYDLAHSDERARSRVLKVLRDFGAVRKQLSVWELDLPDDPKVLGELVARLRVLARRYRLRVRVLQLCEYCASQVLELGEPLWSELSTEEIL